MYRSKQHEGQIIRQTPSQIGESIEARMRRILNNKEKITTIGEPIFTKRADGVRWDTDIRADRFDHALDEISARVKNHEAKRLSRTEEAKKNMEKEAETDKTTVTTEVKPKASATDLE